ncbi:MULTISPECIES: Stealth CR1 domain-containing protein [Salegentibacter]|uniref:Stealth CR1 domain-containing protein n=1 Tax=Salegentibacter TaxID=143222 RepID=UPI00187B465C|nr:MULTISPECIES: Stealth CR1 domain-containing protein [Salegentibacter]MBE7640352.1 capsular biosynthesis protein [Salegentibacter sp. BLCTC]MBI6117843.1 Stealth CR1 domain-containing protein [Salegentibacter maritimus]
MKESLEDIPVDAVITWVDGDDKNWQKKINDYSKSPINFSSKKHLKRYNSIGEIDMAIKSIIKFAPFIRNIFLVTDNQSPESFDHLKSLAQKKGMNLELVDHEIIFRGFEEYLPTFNSCSIISMLYRIPNLSEHFIIFNDDTFVMKEVSVDDFFINGEPIIRGKWQDFNENKTLRKSYHEFLNFLDVSTKKDKISFKKLQQNSAKMAKMDKYVRRFHTPVSVRKSTLTKFFKEDSLLRNNIQHRFRNPNQFLLSSLSEHLEIKNNTYHYRSYSQLTYFRSYKNLSSTKLKLKWFEKNQKKLFLTFQTLDMANDEILNYILLWIKKRLSES